MLPLLLLMLCLFAFSPTPSHAAPGGAPAEPPAPLAQAEIIVVRTDAPEVKADTFRLQFRVNDTRIEPSLAGNAVSLDALGRFLREVKADSAVTVTAVNFLGGASPEGTDRSNRVLCEGRADALRRYMGGMAEIPDSLFFTHYTGSDWVGLLHMVEADPAVPCREATMALIRSIIADGRTSDAKRARLRGLCNGRAYRYILDRFFPALRTSRVIIATRRAPELQPEPALPEPSPAPVENEPILEPAPAPVDTVVAADTVAPRPFYMDVRTNLLYDAALIPNVGVQVYVGRNFSVIADWQYAWWSCDTHHRYWRIYGGDLGARWWFGRAARRKPLTGHHIGVYGQILTFDFEFGGRGYMGGKPGGTLWDKMQLGAGIEYGFTLPIKPRLNLDFSIGIGYLGGVMHEYLPIDGHYVWQLTKNYRWVGPTKAEVSLVWLLGRGNRNEKKGGETR